MSAPGTTPPFQGQPQYGYAPAPPPKRSNPWKWIVLGCGGLALLGCIGVVALFSLGLFGARNAAQSTPVAGSSGNSGASVASQGQVVSVKNWNVSVASVDRPGKDLVWSQFNNKSTAAGTWVVVVVKMKNTGNQNFGVNNPDFELRAAGGTKYNVSSDAGSYSYSTFKGGQQVGGQVPPGVEVTYYIPFDVAPTATDLQLVFKQDKNPAFAIGNAAP